MVSDALKRELAQIAQEEYDDWEAKCGWGCCGRIATAISARLMLEGLEAVAIDLNSEPPHTLVWASDGVTTVSVDVPWHRYERYTGVWHKISGVTLTDADIIVTRINTEEGAEFAEESKAWMIDRQLFATRLASGESPRT